MKPGIVIGKLKLILLLQSIKNAEIPLPIALHIFKMVIFPMPGLKCCISAVGVMKLGPMDE